MHKQCPPDLDAIARNLTALDLAHLTPEEVADCELELSVVASLNEVLDIAVDILRTPTPPEYWQRLYPLASEAAALLASQLSPLLDINAERSFPIADRPIERPFALSAHPLHSA